MTQPAITVRGLSKAYRIAHNRLRRTTLADALMERLRNPFRRQVVETFWALREISFNVNCGEALAIIGRNGAGKSTLLKLLSLITEPTAGRIELYGRVGSLLEVGTGFHPELTGRENIYLNGSILGMRSRDIDRKFDQIVEFAEIEKFLDTPVKRYSSGMYVRLAFAVAAHLNPQILIVDEVLAVGDMRFQKKCLGKMGEVAAQEGRTVLFVSHNMTAVQSLCTRAIWLEGGRIIDDGPVDRVVSRYARESFAMQTQRIWEDPTQAPGNDIVRIRRVSVRPASPSTTNITVRTSIILEFEYWNFEPGTYLNLSLHVFNEDGIRLFNTGPVREPNWQGKPFPKGLFRSVCYIPGDLLNNGTHRVQLMVVRDQSTVIFTYDEALVFDVADSHDLRGAYHGKWEGALRPDLDWETDLIDEGPSALRTPAPARQEEVVP